MAELKTETITVNFGPQHPSTHGVLYLLVELSGEIIVHIEANIGYLHRSFEKLAEYRHYNQFSAMLDRADYMSAFFNETAFNLAIEKIAGVRVPERAEYLRVILMELNRISSHLLFYGTYGLDIGAQTPFLYAFREREKILDLFDMAAGYRMTPNYIRVGGVKEDVTDEFLDASLKFCAELPGFVSDYEGLLTGNEIFQLRTQGLGLMEPADAINFGLTGPVLRATGVDWDLRRDDPYGIYDRFEFEIPVFENGDCFDAYRIRLKEMLESAKIVKQAIDSLPDGPVRLDLPIIPKPPRGEAYARVESPRGELGMYVVSDGSEYPWRAKVRPPSFVNLAALPHIAKGWKIADLVAYVGVLDIVLGEIDR